MTTSLINHLKKTHEKSKTDFRWRNLRNLVKTHIQGTNILDAGCGTGHLTLELLQDGFTVTATDYSQDLVDFTKGILQQAGFSPDIYQLDLREAKTLSEENYDTIVCLDVLEHIDDDLIALKNLKNALKPGGVLIISVPAIGWLYSHRDEEIGHYRRYNKPELLEKLMTVGFETSTIRFWNFIGLFPYLISEKLLKISIDKNVRNNSESTFARIANNLLNVWFEHFENNLSSPIGLSLIAVCTRPKIREP